MPEKKRQEARKGQAMHVAKVRRVHEGKTYESHLIRRSYREDGKVKHETLANISRLPPHVIELLTAALQGGPFVLAEDAFEILDSRHHGHVQAVLDAMKRLDFAKVIGSRPSRQRDLVVAMVAARILEPESKLATTRWWHTTSLPGELGISDATEDDLYDAMDWLIERQDRIEKKLAARHLDNESLVLYDLSSSYVEGTHCPLAALGHNRDGKKGKLQINYGLVTDSRGCPVAVTVYPGNTGDSTTLMDQVYLIKESFKIPHVALVGDRGMISQKQIDQIKGMEGVDWITALKSPQIRKLVEQRYIQLGLFDERNIFELTHPDFPGERLVACRNPELAKQRAYKRQDLLRATIKELEAVAAMIKRRHLSGKADIGVRVGRIIDKYKVAKHFDLEIADDSLAFVVNEDRVAAEAALDGIYVIRTSLPQERLGTDDTVRSYKSLNRVERAFRSIKTIDLKVRPIYHHLEDRVRAHVFLAMLAYYVEWHLRAAWRELLFDDEDQVAKLTRDPVAPAKRSKAALYKARTQKLDDGTPVHSFRTLLQHLSAVVKSTCRRKGAEAKESTFESVTTLNAKQKRAFSLIDTIAV